MQARKYILSALAVIFIIADSIAQYPAIPLNCPHSAKQAEVWFFGEKAGIDFRSGTAIPDTSQNSMLALKASAVICDSTGDLLFFTNGRKVYDKQYSVMPNGTELYGNLGVTQPCIIVPMPGFPDIYYIFAIDLVFGLNPTKGLTYSILDMSLRNGFGDVTDRHNQPLHSPVCQKLSSVKHRNGKDYWILIHEWNSDKFFAYLLTSSGLSDSVVSAVGTPHDGDATENNDVGYMKFSPDGSHIALTIPGKNMVEEFDFNNETGIVSAPRNHTFSLTGVQPYGVEFSPDSRKLYVSVLQLGGNGPPTAPSYIFQFDVRDNLMNPIQISSIQGVRVTAMQLATDGRIYLARTVNLTIKKDSLDVIYNPSRSGLACNYNSYDGTEPARFSLLGRYPYYSLPNFVQSYLDIPVFTWDSCCYQDFTQFKITNKANIDQVIWNFGDGGTSTEFDPLHRFDGPGIYQVSVTETFKGEIFIDTVSVTVHPKPVINLGDTVFLYKGSVINLHAGGGFQEYIWSTGATDSVISVADNGEFWARVKDYHCCINADTTYVRVYQYIMPTAFTPNGDGLNDVFNVVGSYRNIEMQLFIYNRWGQMVFQSGNMDEGWDGTFGNKKCEPDTYAWRANIRFLGQDIITQGNIVLKGTVILVR